MSVQDTNISAKTGAHRAVLSSKSDSFGSVRLYHKLFKRLLDVFFVVLALPIVLPIVVVLAVLAARDGASPFYGQRRVGRDGRIFTMWKLRTMVPNAQSMLDGYLAQNPVARREWEETQKLKDDPRITHFGQLLRKTSLDELPQLWNVLIGDMSLVGPRPMLPEQQKLYPGKAYFSLRPGLTGAWQVSERNASSFASRADFDTSYANDLTFKTDVGILYATIGVVVRATGY